MAATENLTLHRYPCSNTGYVEDLGNGVKLTMMQIPAGEFLMGRAVDDPDISQIEVIPQHWVKVPRFFMGQTPVTQAQWRIVAGYDPVNPHLLPHPSRFKDKDDDLPVEQVSWHNATEFCRRLTAELTRRRSPQKPPVYRLPSEAEWEYACRAGTTTAYHFGDQITKDLANYAGGKRSRVASYPPNRWGLYDMHGNVWEWCEDRYHSSYEGAPVDGSAWLEGSSDSYRVFRGGSWNFSPRFCQAGYRGYLPVSIGFRVVCRAP